MLPLDAATLGPRVGLIVSETSERAGSSEIDRLLQGCSMSHSFGSWTISDLFQAFGKVLFAKELC